MKYQNKILKGSLIKRYKRFFANIKLDKKIITAYCPNTGSLLGLLNEGLEVLVAVVDNPKAKLHYRLEAIKSGKVFVGINTSLPNLIVYEAISNKKILKTLNYENLRKEVKYGKNSRIDILAEGPSKNKTYIEIKSVTLSRQKNLAEFPDAITSRGSKHLVELSNKCIEGHQSYLIYLIQRKDIKNFSIAKDIDPEYYKNSQLAKKNGVKFIAYICDVSFDGIEIIKEIKIIEH